MTASIIWRAWFCPLLGKITHATLSWRKLTFWKWLSASSEISLPAQSKVSIIPTANSAKWLLFSYFTRASHESRVTDQISPLLPPDSADSYREGYKACLQRVSTLLPKTSLDQDACQRVHDFVQQSMSTNVTPACLNCCAQSSRTLPQIQQRLLSLKSSFNSRLESQSRSVGAVAPSRAQPGSQPVSAAMWRPW